MDREEAINVVKGARQYLMAGNPIWDVKKIDEAMSMAIEALSAETPTDQQKHQLSEETPTNIPTDLISRADAIGIVEDYIGKDYMTPMSRLYSVRSELSALPSADRPSEEWKINCTDFVDWLLEKVLDEEDWDISCKAYGEIICRKLKKLGVVTVKDGYYIIADNADRPAELLQDGTLKVHTKNGMDVKRVLVLGDDFFGGLYYLDDRQSGEWICKDSADMSVYWFECSECGEKTPRDNFNHEYKSNYCPNCGAKMGGNK